MPHIDGSEARIYYEQHGEGPDIVWVSGGGGLASDWHPYQIPFFDQEFRNTTCGHRRSASAQLIAEWMPNLLAS